MFKRSTAYRPEKLAYFSMMNRANVSANEKKNAFNAYAKGERKAAQSYRASQTYKNNAKKVSNVGGKRKTRKSRKSRK